MAYPLFSFTLKSLQLVMIFEEAILYIISFSFFSWLPIIFIDLHISKIFNNPLIIQDFWYEVWDFNFFMEITSCKKQSLNSSLIIKWLETSSCSILLLQLSFKIFQFFLHLLSWCKAFKIQVLRGIGVQALNR